MPSGIARICNDARAAKARSYVLHSVEHCTGAASTALRPRRAGRRRRGWRGAAPAASPARSSRTRWTHGSRPRRCRRACGSRPARPRGAPRAPGPAAAAPRAAARGSGRWRRSPRSWRGSPHGRPRAARPMHAGDLVVVAPQRHQLVQVGLLQRFVELRLDLVGQRHQRSSLGGVARHQRNTTVLWPFISTRRSTCQRTARASTRHSMSRPTAVKPSADSEWSTRCTSCSMIGPSSRSAVT